MSEIEKLIDQYELIPIALKQGRMIYQSPFYVNHKTREVYYYIVFDYDEREGYGSWSEFQYGKEKINLFTPTPSSSLYKNSVRFFDKADIPNIIFNVNLSNCSVSKEYLDYSIIPLQFIEYIEQNPHKHYIREDHKNLIKIENNVDYEIWFNLIESFGAI